MKTKELLALFRREANDLASPPLWSDEEVYEYMTAAQEMFCRMTHGIRDSSSELTKVAVVADDPLVVFDPKILRIRSARLESDGRELTLINPEDLSSGYLSDDYGLAASRIDLTLSGIPKMLLVGDAEDTARLVHIPIDDDTLLLIVERLPLEDLLSPTKELEIPPQHHRYLVQWMLHLAYMKQDAEAYNRGRSEEFAARFAQYCELAKRESERRIHKHRTISYGGY